MFLRDRTSNTQASNMDRRRWIGSIAGAGIGLAGFGTSALSADKKAISAERQKYQVGCSGRSFHRQLSTPKKRGEMSLPDFIKKCGQWNCDCIELLNTNFTKTDNAYLDSIKREAFLQSVDLSGMSVYTNFIQTDKKKIDAEHEKVRKWIDHTARLGAPLLVVFPGGNNRSIKMSKARQLVADSLSKLADYAQKQGVILALENHGMLTRSAEDVLWVLEKVDHPWVGLNLDTGNFRNKPYENMAQMASKAINCHLKLDVRNGKKKLPADLKRKFDVLRKSGYTGRVTLQYELSADPYVEVPKYLKEIQALAK